MNEKRELAERIKSFALRIIKMYTKLPKSAVAEVLGKQVLRSGTSVGAHYREARRARSTAEFISKIEVAIQELDETTYWLDLIVSSEIISSGRLINLQKEAGELLAILVASVKTAKRNKA
ncbi:MAG TPA: four helix bundle protein [Pirellulales bacterium]|jgi:four helix bundle protein